MLISASAATTSQDKFSLAITIPTYDRSKQLERCLEVLAPQLARKCRLYILDNASPISAESIARPIFKKWNFSNYQLIRHRYNIGGLGNIQRCFEVAEEQWLWILGDDDVPMPGAIQRVLDLIENHPNATFFTFNVSAFQKHANMPEKDITFRNLTDFLSSGALVCGSLISSGIYNLKHLRPYIDQGYWWDSSFYPHLAILFEALQRRPDIEVVFKSEALIDCVNDGYEDSLIRRMIGRNVRYLTRQLQADAYKQAFMSNSLCNSFGPPEKCFFSVIVAGAFRKSSAGILFFRRIRVVLSDSIQFDNVCDPIPFQSVRLMVNYLIATCIGIMLGPLIRYAYKVKQRGSWEKDKAPSMILEITQPEVP